MLRYVFGKSPLSRCIWESRYKLDGLDYLKELDELARYSIISGYFRHFKRGGSVLDLGCGEGILQEKIGSGYYSRYLGVDISSEAIKRASTKSDHKTAFMRFDISKYVSQESFDAIVFNEVLYYLDDPLDTVDRYSKYLNNDGILIISMYVDKYFTKRTSAVWEKIGKHYSEVDMVEVTNKSGVSWVCKTLVPQRQ